MYKQLSITIFAVCAFICLIRFVRDTRAAKLVTLSAAALYFVAILYFTMNRPVVSSGFNFKLPLPFVKALLNRHYGLVANRSMLNLLLFVPLGYCIPSIAWLFGRRIPIDGKQQVIKSLRTMTLVGLSVSLAIETAQIVFKLGVFELDDLVKNSLGAAVGFMIFVLLNRGKNARKTLQDHVSE